MGAGGASSALRVEIRANQRGVVADDAAEELRRCALRSTLRIVRRSTPTLTRSQRCWNASTSPRFPMAMSERRREWNTSVVAVEVDGIPARMAPPQTPPPHRHDGRRARGGGSALRGRGDGAGICSMGGRGLAPGGTSEAPIRPGRGGKWRSRMGAHINSRRVGINRLEPLSPHYFFPSKGLFVGRGPPTRSPHPWRAKAISATRVPERVHHGVLGPYGCAREPVSHLPPGPDPVLPRADYRLARRQLALRLRVRRRGQEGLRDCLVRGVADHR